MAKSGIKWVSVSLSEDEKKFIDDNQISPTKLFKWALTQRGFKRQRKL